MKLKAWRKYNERLRSESKLSIQTNQRGGLLARRRQDNSTNDRGVQTTLEGSNGSAMQGPHSVRTSGRGNLLRESENGRNSDNSTRENVSGKSRVQTTTSQSLSKLGNHSSWGGELGIHSVHDTNGQGKLRNLRRYSNEVTDNQLNKEKYMDRVREVFSIIESNPNMYMSDKTNALMSIIDEVAHEDIALGLKGEDRLSYQLLTTDNRNKRLVSHLTPSHEYQEFIACAMNQSHNNKPRVNH